MINDIGILADLENAKNAATAAERAAVVAYLRGFDTESASSDIRWCIRGLANCIERGEHCREEE